MHQTKNDLPEETRMAVIELLNNRLADVVDLKTQLKQAHWNIKGMSFSGLHDLFDEAASSAEEYTDLIADRHDLFQAGIFSRRIHNDSFKTPKCAMQ